MDTFDVAFEAALGTPPPDVEGPLKERWEEPLGAVASLAPLDLPDGQCERHRIYCLLLLALLDNYWNPLKRGRRGRYPWLESSAGEHPLDFDYLGHNIAALAVDGKGHVLDFEFNHNAIFDSSAQHAEARLVRRLYSLAHVSDSWSPVTVAGQGGTRERPRYVNLSDVTVYTSLESCSQCSGALMLAQVREVVYLQTDPGAFWIGRILHNLSTDALRAPLPVAGSEVGLDHFAELDAGYARFKRGVGPERPFFVSESGEVDAKPSVTSFLCTEDARATFARGAADFAALGAEGALRHPDYRPPGAGDALTNAAAVHEAIDFLDYAVHHGSRATPHGT